MHEVRLDTARGELAALRGGRAGGPPLLCLHGWLDNAASFVPLAAQLPALKAVHEIQSIYGHDAFLKEDAFVGDISTEAFQQAAAPFQGFADAPQFILTEDL